MKDEERIKAVEEFIDSYLQLGQSWEMYMLLEKRDEAIGHMYWSGRFHAEMSVMLSQAEASYEAMRAKSWAIAKSNGLSDRRCDMKSKEDTEGTLHDVARISGLVSRARNMKTALNEIIQSMKQRISVDRSSVY